MASAPALPSPSPATATPLIGMFFDSLPPMSIYHIIFWVLEECGLENNGEETGRYALGIRLGIGLV